MKMKRILSVLLLVLVATIAMTAKEMQDTVLRKKLVQPDSVHEYVKIGKDTIDIVVKERNFSRFDRGLKNYVFCPKGQISFGLNASVGNLSSDDVQFLGYINDLTFKVLAYSIKPNFSYFFKNNQSIGVRLGVTNYKIDLNSLAVEFDDDINFNLKDVYYKSNNFTVSAFYRHYIGLDRGRRFAVFNETELAYSAGKTTFQRNYNGVPKVTETNSQDWRLNFSPGIMVFLHERVGFNVSFGIFGIYYKNENQKVDGEKSGTNTSAGASFKFNLFNINFGLAVHI